MLFDSFVASVGAGIPITESRKNCQINVKMHVPNGWQFSVMTVDYRGQDIYVFHSFYFYFHFLHCDLNSKTFLFSLIDVIKSFYWHSYQPLTTL